MDRLTRKTLKDDRFAAEVTHSVEYLTEHRRQALLYGGIAAVVLALAAGIYFYRQRRAAAGHEALYKALQTYHALVTDEDRPGRTTFHTAAEKHAQALKDFQALARGFSGRTEGRIGGYYLGLVYHEMGKPAEAQKELESVIGRGHDSVGALARLTLAEIYHAQGKDEEAGKNYQYLIQNPTETVPENRARLALARSLRERNPQEARKLLLELEKRPGPIAAAAGTALRELGGL